MENLAHPTFVGVDSGTRARIITAARKRFEAFGYRRTNVAEIAKDAGVAVGTLYGHFKSKEEILLKVMQEMNEAWLQRAREAASGPGSAAERLTRLGDASIENNKRNKLLNSILSRDTEMIPAPLIEPLHQADVTQNVAIIAGIIRDGISEGTFQPIDAERAAFVLFTSGEALYRQALHSYSELQPVFSQIILSGLLRRHAPRSASSPKNRRFKRQ